MSYSDLELKVVRWAEDRKIVQNSSPVAQARKTLEEAGELLEAAACLPHDPSAMAAYRDALADVLITLVVGAACADVDLIECFAGGYEVIKDRKGYLRADGVFVKQS